VIYTLFALTTRCCLSYAKIDNLNQAATRTTMTEQFPHSMDTELEPAAAMNFRPVTSTYADLDPPEDGSIPPGSERLKRRNSGPPAPEWETAEGRSKILKTEQPDKLCDTCIGFAKEFSRRAVSQDYMSISHTRLGELYTAARDCPLCYMLCKIVRPRPEPWCESGSLFFKHTKEACVNTDGHVAQLWLRLNIELGERESEMFCLAVHTDSGTFRAICTTLAIY
jgi:hypothetical protein